jgi:hypothetical protein
MAEHTKEVRLHYMDGLSRRGHAPNVTRNLKIYKD